MKQYLSLLENVLTNGKFREDRTGTGTYSVFGAQAVYDLREGFPLLTTKKMHLKSVIYDLSWMLKGDTNIKYLNENGVTIWDEWADSAGELGRIYGAQWRDWRAPNGKSIDQIAQLVKGIKDNPHSRRHIINAWNVGELNQMSMPPCQTLCQFYVQDDEISCQLYQRSGDLFLGVPFNLAEHSLLIQMVVQVTDKKPGRFIHTFGDLHLYQNHLEQAKLQLKREPRPLPNMNINPDVKNIFDFKYEDFELQGYDPHPSIKAPVAV